MNNFKKLLPVFALVAGLGLVFTQSAPTSISMHKYMHLPIDMGI